jgi:hypothetical protein
MTSERERPPGNGTEALSKQREGRDDSPKPSSRSERSPKEAA